MVILKMNGREFGLNKVSHVSAHYDTLEAAVAQAEHNIAQGKQTPIEIVDADTGEVLWMLPS